MKKSPKAIALCFGLLLAVAALAPVTSAQAGQLFPPKNVDQKKSCPAGTTLVWSTVGDEGHVDCISTTSMVTVASCPAGQVMAGITNGVPVCVAQSGGGGDVDCFNGGIGGTVPLCINKVTGRFCFVLTGPPKTWRCDTPLNFDIK